MSSLAYFLAKDTIDHFNTVIKPIVYLSMFYFFNNPRSSIADNYVILLALVYCVTGIGYTFAICFQPGSAQLVRITETLCICKFVLLLSNKILLNDIAVVCPSSCCFNACSDKEKRPKITLKLMLPKVGTRSFRDCQCQKVSCAFLCINTGSVQVSYDLRL